MNSYLFVFSSSCLLLYLAQKYDKKYPYFQIPLFILAAIIPAVLAAVRDDSIGTDTLVYANPVFADALTAPNINGMEERWDGWIAKSYLWMNFIMSRITTHVEWVHFLIAFMECMVVILALNNCKRYCSIWIGMLVYFCFFYVGSFNLIRQYLACSMGLFAVTFLLKNKPLYFYLIIAISMLFHTSNALFVFIHLVYLYTNHFKTLFSKLILIGVSISIVVSAQVFFDQYLALMTIIGFDFFARYFLESNDFDGGYKTVFLFAPLILFVIPFKKRIEKYTNHYDFFVCIIMIIIFGALLPLTNSIFLIRIVIPFNWMLCFILPMIAKSTNKFLIAGQQLYIVRYVITLYSIAYFVVVYVIYKAGEAYPYTSKILDSTYSSFLKLGF
ncbi:hypothetical protein AGMMS49938_04450 [Fibrobacterales bacterium]|nr:hypothetical protein AGMMS49938_04450 [Fibrobacterales bacterium]